MYKEEKRSFLLLLKKEEEVTKDHPRHMPHSTVYKTEEWTTEPVEVAGRLAPFDLHMCGLGEHLGWVKATTMGGITWSSPPGSQSSSQDAQHESG